jgi:lipoate-protein ligase B
MHGVAINVDIRSLGNFDGIVPCGLEGREVTCVNNEIVGKQYTLQEFAVHLKAALEEIFGITLVIVA